MIYVIHSHFIFMVRDIIASKNISEISVGKKKAEISDPTGSEAFLKMSVPGGFEMSWLIMTSGGRRSLVFTHEETQERVHCSCSHSKKGAKQPKTTLPKVISGAVSDLP